LRAAEGENDSITLKKGKRGFQVRSGFKKCAMDEEIGGKRGVKQDRHDNLSQTQRMSAGNRNAVISIP
jgi:hypothetical protein